MALVYDGTVNGLRARVADLEGEVFGPDASAYRLHQKLTGVEPLSTATVLAPGASTARTLAARAGDVVNVADYATPAAAHTAAEADGRTVFYPAGTHAVAANFTIAGSVQLARGARIRPASGVAVTIGAAAVIHADGDWQDTSAGGSFTISNGSFERRLLTKSSVPTGGFSENLGSPANSIHESSGTCYVRGGTPSSPHTVGAASELSVIGGGYDNQIGGTATASTIAGGAHHRIADGASHSAILGGAYQTSNTDYAALGGGTLNKVESTYSGVFSGQSNTAGDAAQPDLDTRSAFVGGGALNEAKGLRSSVVGGNSNTASGQESAILGGASNTASGQASAVGGGTNNTASAQTSTVVGGVANAASGLYSTAGGSSCAASANFAVAIGDFCEASGSASVATGSRSKAPLRGQRAHGSGYFAAKGDAQLSDLVARIETTTATPAVLDLLGGAVTPIALPDNTTWVFVVHVVARRADADGENAAYRIEGAIKRDTGVATTALMGSPTVTVIHEDVAGWDAAATADTTNGALKITVTGEADKTIRWVARIALTEVSG